jgi:L-ascorbate metabolism protein UlaG (beta-lactamase superfamily)
VPEPNGGPTLRLVGGPTALISYGGLRLLTDPTFSPPGELRRPGTDIVLRKLTGPAVPPEAVEPIDAVLLSHDHHLDNLDPIGREFLPRAGRVLTTGDGAERLEVEATGMEPGDSVQLEASGRAVEIVAVRADHGPTEVAPKNGPVIGFVLRGEALSTIYVSGDNASVEVVREIAGAHGPIDASVLFCGGAEVPEAWGPDAYLTLTPETAVEAARLLGDGPIVPIHQEGWAHFSFGPEDLSRAFEDAGEGHRLHTLAPGEEIALDPQPG